jgi:hypothetical protein
MTAGSLLQAWTPESLSRQSLRQRLEANMISRRSYSRSLGRKVSSRAVLSRSSRSSFLPVPCLKMQMIFARTTLQDSGRFQEPQSSKRDTIPSCRIDARALRCLSNGWRCFHHALILLLEHTKKRHCGRQSWGLNVWYATAAILRTYTRPQPPLGHQNRHRCRATPRPVTTPHSPQDRSQTFPSTWKVPSSPAASTQLPEITIARTNRNAPPSA